MDEVASRVFGVARLRAFQATSISHDLAGRNLLLVAGTGAGKSLCFQVPAVMRKETGGGATVVVSPLVALIKDQVDALARAHVPVTEYSGDMPAEGRKAFFRTGRGDHALVYVTPEGLVRNARLVNHLVSLGPARFVFDEAHCIVEWGLTFRPAYKQALEVCHKEFPSVPLSFLTATAPADVRERLLEHLKASKADAAATAAHSPIALTADASGGVMDNPSTAVPADVKKYEVLDKPDLGAMYNHMAKDLKSLKPDEAGLVYCLTREETETVSRELQARGVPCTYFHADLKDMEKKVRQEAWLGVKPGASLGGRYQTLVCTPAFGMGINHPRVRFVFHASMPLSMSSYIQQTGRAGRDGKGGSCVLFYRYSDAMAARRIVDLNPTPTALDGLERLKVYCKNVVRKGADAGELVRAELTGIPGTPGLGRVSSTVNKKTKNVEEVLVNEVVNKVHDDSHDSEEEDDEDPHHHHRPRVELEPLFQVMRKSAHKSMVPTRRALDNALKAKARGDLTTKQELAWIKGWTPTLADKWFSVIAGDVNKVR